VDGHDRNAVEAAITAGRAETARPTLIVTRTHIGFGAPKKQDSAEAHGAPLGKDELKATKRHFGLPEDKDFYVPDEVRQLFAARVEEVKREHQLWKTRFAAWQQSQPALARRWEAARKGEIDQATLAEVRAAGPAGAAATRAHSGKVTDRGLLPVRGRVGGPAPLDEHVHAAYPAAAGKFEGGTPLHPRARHGLG
jgi:transketolase